MFVNINDVRVGDVIVEGSGREQSRTTVKKVETSPNSCIGKVHINEKDCYEGFVEVKIQETRQSEELPFESHRA